MTVFSFDPYDACQCPDDETDPEGKECYLGVDDAQPSDVGCYRRALITLRALV
ncbi:MAG: hypothetical protein AB8B82_00775 [Roseovarius sp.]